jgi:hypothetical protein
MNDKRTCVVYLAREPAGVAPFLESYARHPAGSEHTLLYLIKGERVDPAVLPKNGIVHKISDHGFDLTAYRKMFLAFPDFDYYCCLDSWSVILCDDWLLKFHNAFRDERVGIVGASGSHESFYSNTPHKFWNRLFFKPFPNPHIRTTGFMIRAPLMKQVWPKFTPLKRVAYMAESGRNNITRKVQRLGYEAVVVNSRGAVFKPQEWRESFTYRAGQQQFLMISDKRTVVFETATPEEKLHQAWAAWQKHRNQKEH